jgi:hypothetical protein
MKNIFQIEEDDSEKNDFMNDIFQEQSMYYINSPLQTFYVDKKNQISIVLIILYFFLQNRSLRNYFCSSENARTVT